MYFLWCSRGSAPASVAAVCDRRWALKETPQVKAALQYLTEIAMLAKRPPPVGTVPCNRLASAHCFFLKNKLDDCPSHFENAHLLSPMNLHLQPQEFFFSPPLQTSGVFVQHLRSRFWCGFQRHAKCVASFILSHRITPLTLAKSNRKTL